MYINLKPLAQRIESNIVTVGQATTLGILKHGERADSTDFIRSIERKALQLGVKVTVQDLEGIFSPRTKVLETILLADAILPIKPFPQHMENIIKSKLDIYKNIDVDNFAGTSPFKNCTGEATLEILKYLGIGLEKDICIVGRHIGLDIYNVLLNSNYTPRPIHSETPNPLKYMQNADVLISATGVKQLIKKDMVKPGALVIDIGLGDVEESVAKFADVTPVKDGVGAVTTSILFRHIFETIK